MRWRRSHIQHRVDDLERSGLDRADAERRARIEFAGHVPYKEESREALGGNFIETLVLVGLLATWIPAQRTLSVDPLILLRAE